MNPPRTASIENTGKQQVLDERRMFSLQPRSMLGWASSLMAGEWMVKEERDVRQKSEKSSWGESRRVFEKRTRKMYRGDARMRLESCQQKARTMPAGGGYITCECLRMNLQKQQVRVRRLASTGWRRIASFRLIHSLCARYNRSLLDFALRRLHLLH